MRVYISGPITGIPNQNREAFEEAARTLGIKRYTAINPLKLVSDPTVPYEECLAIDLLALATCDAIMMLPGWRSSKGARLELAYAKKIGIEILGTEDVNLRRQI